MMRLFVALRLPEEVRRRLAGLCGGVPGARWVDSGTLHLTLRFIGETDEGRLGDLDAELAAVRVPAFPLVLEGVGQFGTRRRAHTLWVGVAHDEALFHLQAKIESAVVRAGFAPEPRKFTPHVTLARLKEVGFERLTHFLAGNGLFRSEPMIIDSFALWSSHSSRSGSLYQVVQCYRLDGNGDCPLDDDWDWQDRVCW